MVTFCLISFRVITCTCINVYTTDLATGVGGGGLDSESDGVVGVLQDLEFGPVVLPRLGGHDDLLQVRALALLVPHYGLHAVSKKHNKHE